MIFWQEPTFSDNANIERIYKSRVRIVLPPLLLLLLPTRPTTATQPPLSLFSLCSPLATNEVVRHLSYEALGSVDVASFERTIRHSTLSGSGTHLPVELRPSLFSLLKAPLELAISRG
jgi:hypothetical protein